MSFNEVVDIQKAIDVLAKIKNSDLAGREFTRKEFDKIFKGTEDKKGISLKWLMNNGEKDGHIRYSCSWWNRDGKVNLFVTVAREEKFELPFKEEPWGGYDKEERVLDAEGNIVDCNVKLFKTDAFYREMVEQKHGQCIVETVEIKTFTAKRFFYTFDMDALEKVAKSVSVIKDYYEKKLAKAEAEVEKCKTALALIQ